MLALSNFMRRVLSGAIKPGVPRAMTTNAWRQESETPSLSEVFRTIAVGNGGTSRFRRFLAFIGPGYLVAVGYMDPGNWATSLAGGAAFGYTLLFVALLSNIMAILLQSLCARLAVASGRDLAQACRDAFPKWMSVPLWIFAELAIIATGVDKTWGSCGAFSVCDGQPTIENCGPCDGYSVSPFGRPPHPSALSHAGIGNVID